MLKIVSWNVLNTNLDCSRLQSFLENVQADIYCLQELTEEHCSFLQKQDGYKLFISEDFYEKDKIGYLGLFSRFPLLEQKKITHNINLNLSQSVIGHYMKWVECITSQSSIVNYNGKVLRIINLHLSCAASPRERQHQLHKILDHCTTEGEPTVICGDFNSFAHPLFNFLIGWFYGFSFKDLLVEETQSLKNFMRSKCFQEAIKLGVTFPKHMLHLDHIFVRNIAINSSSIITCTYGSDHRPIAVSLEDV